jgi:hypothetical protein
MLRDGGVRSLGGRMIAAPIAPVALEIGTRNPPRGRLASARS